VLWLMLAGWLLLAPLLALLVGRALAACQHNEDRTVARALLRADLEGHRATGRREPNHLSSARSRPATSRSSPRTPAHLSTSRRPTSWTCPSRIVAALEQAGPDGQRGDDRG
jgi:hypothetical protein